MRTHTNTNKAKLIHANCFPGLPLSQGAVIQTRERGCPGKYFSEIKQNVTDWVIVCHYFIGKINLEAIFATGHPRWYHNVYHNVLPPSLSWWFPHSTSYILFAFHSFSFPCSMVNMVRWFLIYPCHHNVSSTLVFIMLWSILVIIMYQKPPVTVPRHTLILPPGPMCHLPGMRHLVRQMNPDQWKDGLK